MNHSFIDGNKRIGAEVLDIGLYLNNFILKATNDELANEILSLAAGMVSYKEYLHWVQNHI